MDSPGYAKPVRFKNKKRIDSKFKTHTGDF